MSQLVQEGKVCQEWIMSINLKLMEKVLTTFLRNRRDI